MRDDVTRGPEDAFVSRQAAALERWWNTVRWLRPRQLYGRVWFHAYHPRALQRSAPTPRFTSGSWAPSVARPAQLVAPERIELLSETRDISSPSIWNAADVPRLWLYHLHYFDDLNARAAHERAAWHEALLERWISENPPGRGTGWEPYPASKRIVNWIKWAMSGGQLTPGALQSLATQARWLEKRLEWHLLGNHLLVNAKAMAIAGCFFAGAEADRWRQHGAEILGAQLAEQVLADGGHFERSPMYHALVLEDVLDLLNAARCWPERMPSELVDRLRAAAPVMLRLPLTVAPIFEQWLEHHAPERKEKVLNRIRAIRGGRLNDPRFASRMSGEGIFAEQIALLLKVARRKSGMPENLPKLSTNAFRRPPGNQLELDLSPA